MIQPIQNIAQLNRFRSVTLSRELAEHLRQNRDHLIERWGRHIDAATEPMAISKAEILRKAASAYDDYVEALAAGRVESLESYFGRRLPDDLLASGIDACEVFHIIDLLRGMLASDALDRSLFVKFRHA